MTVATAIGTTTGYLQQFAGAPGLALAYSDGATPRNEAEQAERTGFGPATTVGLSPAAQALLARDAAQGTPVPPGLRVERMPIYPLNAGLTPLERAQVGDIIDRYEADMRPGADLRLEAELRSAGLLPEQVQASRIDPASSSRSAEEGGRADRPAVDTTGVAGSADLGDSAPSDTSASGSAPALPPEPPTSRAPDEAPVPDLGEAVREVTGDA